MRTAFVWLIVLTIAAGAAAQEAGDAKPAQRYGIAADLKTYPQSTPKETLASVLKAIDAKRIDYLLAHLADPQFVDRRVAENGGRFDILLQEAKAKLLDDPGTAKQLRRFLNEGEWTIDANAASVRLKDVSDHQVFLRQLGGRWFMENRRKP
ncbi:MAG TPA: hypothetical protein VNK04_04920 [Gemmataceae bacterium]|jgi:hypothetical protein|nr:hypothetical protein [Gemmataceae bacterium]